MKYWLLAVWLAFAGLAAAEIESMRPLVANVVVHDFITR